MLETSYICPNYKKLMKNYPKIKNNVTILQKKTHKHHSFDDFFMILKKKSTKYKQSSL